MIRIQTRVGLKYVDEDGRFCLRVLHSVSFSPCHLKLIGSSVTFILSFYSVIIIVIHSIAILFIMPIEFSTPGPSGS